MKPEDLTSLLPQLLVLPDETEWVEFKSHNCSPQDIGEYLSALANAAALHNQSTGCIVWGVEDRTHRVLGTTFKPRQEKIGNQELENWLATQLSPRIDFRIYEFTYQGHPLVLFEIPHAWHTPVAFRGVEYIRVGSYRKKLKDFPEKERHLWALFSETSFERGVATDAANSDAVLSMID
jgi:ATP-dependent DNA helicase RecG